MKNVLKFVVAICLAAGIAFAEAPEMFRYQGRLVDGTNLVNATLPMSFKLYDALSDGTLLYEDSNDVLVVDGLYSTHIGDDTVLGSLTNALTNTAVYLELTVGSETLSPRERLVSVPYALTGGNTHTHDRIVVLSGNFEFGSVRVGEFRTANLRIYNDGDNMLTVTAVQYSDDSFSGDYSGRILPLQSTNMVVTFSPETEAVYSEEITVNCNKTSGTNTISCTGTGLPMRYQDHGDGTATDLLTGLMWLKEPSADTFSQSEAGSYCSALVTNGYSDWRRPSSQELNSIFREDGDYSAEWEGWAGTPFALISTYYWSSSTGYVEPTGPIGFAVSMSDGRLRWFTKTSRFRAWPVRGGQ